MNPEVVRSIDAVLCSLWVSFQEPGSLYLESQTPLVTGSFGERRVRLRYLFQQ